MKLTSFWLSGLTVLLCVSLAGCDLFGSEESSDASDPNPTNALYVCNQKDATVSIIDPASNSVAETVDLSEKGFSGNAKPHHVVVAPDGSAWYVSLINENAVVKFNAQNEVVGQVSFEAPGMLSLHPSGDRLYAGHTLSIPSVSDDIAAIPSDMSSAEEISVGVDRPHGLKASPTGDYVYSSSLTTNQVVAVDAETNDVRNRASVSGSSQQYIQMDIAPGGSVAYITGEISGQVQVLDLSNPTAPVLVDSVDVGAAPWHPQLADDGQTLYFGSKATNTVYAMDTETLETTTIEGEGLAQPHGSALSPDGQTLYISNNNKNGTYTPSSREGVGTVVAIDTQTNEIEAVIEVGRNPAGINTRWQP